MHRDLNKKTISQLKKLADKYFSEFIRDRDEWKCFTCGKIGTKSEIDCGHYIPRDCTELRYSETNCHAQCKGCNIFKKGNYPVYSVKMLAKYGDNILYELDDIVRKYKSDGLRQYKKDFYIDIINRFRENKTD